MNRLSPLAALLCVAALTACEKNAIQDITTPVTGGAFIRFQNYAVNAPVVNFYANDQKLTGVAVSNCTPAPAATDTAAVRKCATTGIESNNGVPYGGAANGANYERLAPGQYTLTGRVAAVADNGVSVASVSMSLASDKFYTYFISGIYNTTGKTADAFVVEDILPTSFDYAKAYVRVVNASSNAPLISATVQTQGATEVLPIATNLAYKQTSQFLTFNPGLTDLSITIGSSTTVFKGVNFIGGHVLTLAVRGDATSSSSTTGLAISGVYNR